MNGNIHVQFLGEGVAATSPPYPTPRGAIPWGHPAQNSDIDKGRFEMARNNFKKAGVDGIVTQVLGDAHKEVARLKDPIDLLFIDADKQGYLDYLTKLLPLVRPGGLIVAHNMASPRPDPAFVKAITTNPELETLFVNMESMGLGITLKKR